MSDQFDAYHVWLGIPPDEQPADYYRLLGIRRFEANPDVIAGSADRQMAHVKTFHVGRHSRVSQDLLSHVAAARLCLLNPERKSVYDEQLRAVFDGQGGKLRGKKLRFAKLLTAVDSGVLGIGAASGDAAALNGRRRKKVRTQIGSMAGLGARHPQGNDLVVGRRKRSEKRRRWLLAGLVGGVIVLCLAVTSVLDMMLNRSSPPEVVRAVPVVGRDLPQGPAPRTSAEKPGPVAGINSVGQPPSDAAAIVTETRNPPRSSNDLKVNALPDSPADPKAQKTSDAIPSEPPMAAASGPFDPIPEPEIHVAQPAVVAGPPQIVAPATVAPRASAPRNGHAKSGGGRSAGHPSRKRNGLAAKPKIPANPTLPVPAPELQKQAEMLLQETFHKELDAAKTSETRVALARKFLDTAAGFQFGEPSRYVLYVKAGELAADAPDGSLIVETMELLSAEYVVNVWPMEAELLKRASKVHAPSTTQESLAKAMLTVSDGAAATDQLVLAQQLVTAARALAQKTHNQNLVKDVSNRGSQIREQKNRYADVSRALDVLAKQPNDPRASGVVGRYRCFYKGEWQTGLPLLAQCDNADLAALAKRSLAPTADPQQQIEIGDLWWQRGEATSGKERQQQAAWACTWYRQALPNSHGLAKTKITKRIEEDEGRKPSEVAAQTPKKGTPRSASK